MGIPKFYRWMITRYPCLSVVVNEGNIPEFDNLYLDMNGIIHNCSHPNDEDPHFRISEKDIFEGIFAYVEGIFRKIRPRKVFFIAVDGVAPRAKMNQQRSRRFCKARDSEASEKRAVAKGEVLPSEESFDSNCITPGTVFMSDLSAQLDYFISSKISSDPLWKDVTVILSGSETPGEGEHKIMEYIRYRKSLPGYDPNTRHCVYGLDADLIMLGLATHDPHFGLLREEIKFGGRPAPKSSKIPSSNDVTFNILHLSLLREYIDFEFLSEGFPSKLIFPYNIESIIDDWILLGFLVGNDFLPNLPDFHINKGALGELLSAYKRVLPSLDGYLNENGTLNLKRFEKFMHVLGSVEFDRFDETYSDMKWIEGKTARKNKKGQHTVLPTLGPGNVSDLLDGKGIPDEKSSSGDADFQRLLASTDGFLSDDDASFNEDECYPWDKDEDVGFGTLYHIEFREHKRQYYSTKMEFAPLTRDKLQYLAEDYVRGIQWVLHYYYHGCVSWSWYYKYHYAPYVTDIKKFKGMKMNFDKKSRPFKPFEQLLAVLPPASHKLLPSVFHVIMTSPQSPIADFYPDKFKTDLNGKQHSWESTVLLPFIDEKRLLSAIELCSSGLTPSDIRLNSYGPMISYSYSQNPLGSCKAPKYFPIVELNRTKKKQINLEDWRVPHEKLNLGLMPGVKLSVYFPGFPTFYHIPHSTFLETSENSNPPGEWCRVNILSETKNIPFETLRNTYLGKEIWVSWPHMREARVVGISDRVNHVYIDTHTSEIKSMPAVPDVFENDVYELRSGYRKQYGITIGETNVILYACPIKSRKYVFCRRGKITIEKIWSTFSKPYALQTTKKDIAIYTSDFQHFHTLKEVFPPGSLCFILSDIAYGCKGTVIGDAKNKVDIKVEIPKEPNLWELRNKEKDSIESHYVSGIKASQLTGIDSKFLARITGTIYLIQGTTSKKSFEDRRNRINVGLSLKFSKRNEETIGYTHKKLATNTWLYSYATLEILNEYHKKFSYVLEYLTSNERSAGDLYYVSDMFPEADENHTCPRLKELTNWLSSLPSVSAKRRPCGSTCLDESAISDIEKTIKAQESSRKRVLKCQIHPKLLYKPGLNPQNDAVPDSKHSIFCLYDRVVNVRQGYSVPIGARGTVIGILNYGSNVEKNIPSKYEVLFDEEFRGGLTIRSSPGRCERLPSSALLKIVKSGTESNDSLNGLVTQSEVFEQERSCVDAPKLSAQITKAEPLIRPPDPRELPPNPHTLFGRNTKVLWKNFESSQNESGESESSANLSSTNQLALASLSLSEKKSPPITFVPLQVDIKYANKNIDKSKPHLEPSV